MPAQITRHMVTVKGERQVHYRRAGSGPPVVLLHQSPTSSGEYIPLIEELAEEFTVFAPDTAGNGMSDPLPKDWPEMEDFADGVANLLGELGLNKVPVYGFHTGGVCALALALRHPDLVSVAIMNGYVQMERAEKDEFLAHYLPPLVPDWSGSHLTWTWSRFREQSVFFPWYRKDAARRIVADLPTAERLHWSVMEVMRAGDNYRRAYRPAFTFDTAAAVRDMKANMVIMTAKTDVLDKYMAVMPPPPKNLSTMSPANPAEAKTMLIELLRRHAAGTPPPVASAKPRPGLIWADYLAVEGGCLYARRNTDGTGRPVVFVHASAASSFGMDRYMQPFIGHRPVLAVDLPGNGESDNPMGKTVTVAAQAKFLAQAIRAAGYSEVDVFGHWGGGSVAVELAAQNPGLVKHLAVPTLMMPTPAYRDEMLAHYTPSIAIDADGGHWLKVWNMVRDQELFSPWFKRKKENVIRSGEADIAPEVIHRRTVDLFKCIDIYQGAYAAHFTFPAVERLKATQCPVLFGSPGEASTQAALAAVSGRGAAQAMPHDIADIAVALRTFFDRA